MAKEEPFRFFERLKGRPEFKLRVGDYELSRIYRKMIRLYRFYISGTGEIFIREFIDILFIPPEPSISFIPAGAPNLRSITIRDKADNTSFLKIEVNNYGQISSG